MDKNNRPVGRQKLEQVAEMLKNEVMDLAGPVGNSAYSDRKADSSGGGRGSNRSYGGYNSGKEGINPDA